MLSTSNWLVFFPIGMAILIAVQLSAAVRGVARDSIVATILKQLVMVMFGLALLGLAFRPSPSSFLWVIAIATLVLVLWWKQRNLNRAQMLLTFTLARTPEQQEMMAREFFTGGHGLVRRKAWQVLKYLQQGLSWEAAAERSALPANAMDKVALRLQSRYGESTLDHERLAVEKQHHRYTAELQLLLGRSSVFAWYLLLVPLLLLHWYYSLPTMLMLFYDLNTDPPGWMLGLDNVRYTLPSVVIVLGAAVLLVISAIPLLPLFFWVFPGMAEWPFLARLFSPLYRELGLSTLAQVCRHENDLATACQTTSQIFPLPFIGRRYRRAASLLQAGAEVNQAFVQAGLASRREVKRMPLGSDSSRIAWSLQQLSESKMERLLRRFSAAFQVFLVVTTCLMAVLVAAVAMLMFDILIRLINTAVQ